MVLTKVDEKEGNYKTNPVHFLNLLCENYKTETISVSAQTTHDFISLKL